MQRMDGDGPSSYVSVVQRHTPEVEPAADVNEPDNRAVCQFFLQGLCRY